MAGSSGTGPREVGPSGAKEKKPRRARFHALVSVGAVMVAIAAIAATTWALSRGGDGADAGPDANEATSASGTPSTDLEWNTATPSPTEPVFSMPTFPTPSPTDDATTTSPFSFPTPSATTTPPLVATPTYRYPYNTPTITTPTIASPTTTPTTTAPTTQPPALTKVRPVEPRATPITRCGTFGSLRVVKTTGVRYVRTVGDGRQGRWVVKASARKGYVIAAGAPTRFHGNLGKFRTCPGDPSIEAVTKAPTGDDPVADPWDVTVAAVVPGERSQQIDVTYAFGTSVLVVGRTGNGWTCREPGGTVIGGEVEYRFEPGTPLSCTFAYAGEAPPDVTLRVFAYDEDDNAVAPHGSVTLAANGAVSDTRTF